MKKVKFLLFLLILTVITFPNRIFADSDGGLVLDTNIITNKASNAGNASEFPIRAQLFSNQLELQAKKKAKQEKLTLQEVQKIDFKQERINQLYATNVQQVKMNLFKSYTNVNLSSHDESKKSQVSFLVLFWVLAIPLLILTGFTSKKIANRKAKNRSNKYLIK